MEIHQAEFLQAVALAGAVALGMNIRDKAREEARVQSVSAQARAAGTQDAGLRRPYIIVAARKVEVRP
jgi:chorismate mutase